MPAPAGRLAIAVLLLLAKIVPATAADAGTAIGTLMGAATKGAAIMAYCAAIDPENKDGYDGLGLRIFDLFLPYYQRADQILPTVAAKMGAPNPQRFPTIFINGLRTLAQTETKDLFATMTAAQALATCRSQFTDAQQGKRWFADPATVFPAEVRIINAWHQPR